MARQVKLGDYVTLPAKPEHGPGRVFEIKTNGDLRIHFPLLGPLTFRGVSALEVVDATEALRLCAAHSDLRWRFPMKRRFERCWSCKSTVSSDVNVECVTCGGWLVCGCGACGCGYTGRTRGMP